MKESIKKMINTKIDKQIIFKIIFCISLPFLTYLLSANNNKIELIDTLILSFICGIFFSFKVFKDTFKKYNYKILSFAIFISLYVEKIMHSYTYGVSKYIKIFLQKVFSYELSDTKFLLIFSILSLPALVQLVYIFIDKVGKKIYTIYKNMEKTDKKIMAIMTIIGFISTAVIYNCTSSFYSARNYKKNNETMYDVIYTSDSSRLFNNNAYLDINMSENDIRQPLFGVFSYPFATVAYILSELLFFIPNSYAIFLNTIQILLLSLSVYMITKMLNLNKKGKILYIIFSFCTFPMIIFSFIMEQYIFALFYLILAIYVYYTNCMETNYMYLGAIGTMITSGVIFPLISKFKSFEYWIKNVLKCFIAFFVIVIVSGRMYVFTTSIKKFIWLLRFSGQNLGFTIKLKQFLYFVQSIFIAPASHIVNNSSGMPTYQLVKVDSVCIVGIIILVLCTISFILNRKEKLSIISFCWVAFSYIVLCLFGWGTKENGLILYSLYFSWAYIVLLYMLLNKLIKNEKVKIGIVIAICVILLCFNIPGFARIINFSLTYYRI